VFSRSHCTVPFRVRYISVLQRYFIVSGNDDEAFRLVSGTGSGAPLELAVSARLDHEATTDYHLVLAAVDGGVPPKTGLVTVHISVADSNDNRPVFDQATYTVTVKEDAAIGTSVARVRAVDADSGKNGQVRYHIDRKRCDAGGQFAVDAVTGVIVTRQPLDYELIQQYLLIVVAADQGPQSLQTSAIVSVEVFFVLSLAAVHNPKNAASYKRRCCFV